jgi:hypothetical protein
MYQQVFCGKITTFAIYFHTKYHHVEQKIFESQGVAEPLRLPSDGGNQPFTGRTAVAQGYRQPL